MRLTVQGVVCPGQAPCCELCWGVYPKPSRTVEIEPTTALYGERLKHPSIGIVTLAYPKLQELRALDAEWMPLRPLDAPHAHWLYATALEETKERFTLLREDGKPCAIWAATKKLARFEGGLWYRLERIETHPLEIGSRIGTATMGCVAKRALESGCTGVLIESFPESAKFYEGFSAERRGLKQWRCPRGLIPFILSGAYLDELAEVFDDLHENDP